MESYVLDLRGLRDVQSVRKTLSKFVSKEHSERCFEFHGREFGDGDLVELYPGLGVPGHLWLIALESGIERWITKPPGLMRNHAEVPLSHLDPVTVFVVGRMLSERSLPLTTEKERRSLFVDFYLERRHPTT